MTEALIIGEVEGTQPEIGPGVFGRIGRLIAGRGVRIGMPSDSSFRRTTAVKLDVDELVLEDGVVVETGVLLQGRRIRLGRKTRVRGGATLKAIESMEIGALSTIGEDCEVSARQVQIGRQLWMLPSAKIGGGSAGEVTSKLVAGPWLHLGMHSFLNTAKPITLGREVGLGTRTALYTHGAYPSLLRGAPVAFAPIDIGDYSWLPGAVVNPGVNIGAHVVVGVNSLVNKDIPSGALAAGSPAKVVKENAYPVALDEKSYDRKIRDFLTEYAHLLTDKHSVEVKDTDEELRLALDGGRAIITWRLVNEGAAAENEMRIGCQASGGKLNIALVPYTLEGVTDPDTLRLVNQLRRYGVRFDAEPLNGRWEPWADVW